MTENPKRSSHQSSLTRRLFIWLLAIALILVAGFFIWFVRQAISVIRHNRTQSRIYEKITTLRYQRPQMVSSRLWEECIDLALTAHCNICFSERCTRYEKMCEFEKQLDEKLKADVDLNTIEWIGQRLQETGPYGYRYMKVSIKWWDRWEDIKKRIEEENIP